MRGGPLQLTIDSTDNRDAAIAAVGALFGVRLGIIPADSDVTPPATPARQRESRRTNAGAKSTRRAASTTKRSRAGRATSSPTGGGQGPAKRSTSSRRVLPTATATSTGDLNARIRAWAQDQGLAIASRGRIPTSITDAYRAANPS
jgi:hypothetical protein